MAIKNVNSRIIARRDTTANWNAFTGFVPLNGEVIIYLDRFIKDGKYIPGIKIGDGNAYCVDLPFISAPETDEILKDLESHINNSSIHVSSDDRLKWDKNIKFDFESENLVITEQIGD